MVWIFCNTRSTATASLSSVYQFPEGGKSPLSGVTLQVLLPEMETRKCRVISLFSLLWLDGIFADGTLERRIWFTILVATQNQAWQRLLWVMPQQAMVEVGNSGTSHVDYGGLRSKGFCKPLIETWGWTLCFIHKRSIPKSFEWVPVDLIDPAWYVSVLSLVDLGRRDPRSEP